jgi:hypothetical protein
MFQIKVAYKIKAHIICPVTFFRKSYRLSDNVNKYGAAIQAEENMAHVCGLRDK